MAMAWAVACWASMASEMVVSLVVFSSARFLTASATSASSFVRASVSSTISWASLAILAVASSISAVRALTASVFSLRVTSLAAISLSHHALCFISAAASFMSLSISSVIIFLTFSNASPLMRAFMATASRDLEWSLAAAFWRNCATAIVLLSSFPSAGDLAAAFLEPVWRRMGTGGELVGLTTSAGRYFSTWPWTTLVRTSMAPERAVISSSLSFCRDWNSEFFVLQREMRSERYFSLEARVSSVSARSVFASPAISRALPLLAVLDLMACSAFSVEDLRSAMVISKAWMSEASSFSRSFFSAVNLSRSFSSMSTTPLDLNS
mmetsp:Transcript_25964/g.50902  ORF Transcript_25964/g.50902 Transcript_25964/m.50902 type:complete len:323 (-) Transcript_25964:789-1757(-)